MIDGLCGARNKKSDWQKVGRDINYDGGGNIGSQTVREIRDYVGKENISTLFENSFCCGIILGCFEWSGPLKYHAK